MKLNEYVDAHTAAIAALAETHLAALAAPDYLQPELQELIGYAQEQARDWLTSAAKHYGVDAVRAELASRKN